MLHFICSCCVTAQAFRGNCPGRFTERGASLLRTPGCRCFLNSLRFVIETREMEPLLLVEDKAELRAMMRKALERAGYSVDEAPDGTAAIHKVRGRRYL